MSMEPIRDPEVLARMRVTFDLYQTAVDMMRQNLRRRHPDASEAEIARRMQEWMLEQPEDPPGTPLRAMNREEWEAKRRSTSPPHTVEDEGSDS